MHQPFPGKSSFPQEVTIVRHQDDDGVLVHSQLLQFFHYSSDDHVHTADHAIIPFDHILVFLQCVKTPFPANPVQ